MVEGVDKAEEDAVACFGVCVRLDGGHQKRMRGADVFLWGACVAQGMRPLQLLSALTSLNMSNNLLTDVEMDIRSLLQLTDLDLSNNQIPSLVSPIRDMTALESLNLANNPIILLPQGLFSASDLC